MFRFTQEPSSGSYFVLSQNYNYDSIVLVVNDVVNVMAAYQLVCKRAVHGGGRNSSLMMVPA